MAKGKFPVLAVILLIFGILWAINDYWGFEINFPWLPTILILVAIAMIFNRFR